MSTESSQLAEITRLTSQALSRPERLAYSVQEAARLLGVSYHTVHRLLHSGRLRKVPGLRINLIPRESLEQLLRDP